MPSPVLPSASVRTITVRHLRAACVFIVAVALLSVSSVAWAASNAVSYWNETAITTSAVHLGRAPAISPVDLAYVHAAIYDAVVAIAGGYTPYAVRLADVPPDASMDAAIAAAAHRVLVTKFPSDLAYLEARYATALAAVPDGPAKTDGVETGERVAAALLAAREGDGWNAAINFVPGSGPGAWQPTPPAFAPAVAPWMAVMRPFTLVSASQFRTDPPPALDSPLWAENYNEVELVGSATSTVRSPAETEMARFYGEHAGIQYARVFRDFAAAQGLGEEDTARLFAMLYVTSADALIGCWDSKYQYAFWRPVTAIRAGDTDGNAATAADPLWTPLLPTPPHPEYPSAHGCFTSSIAEVLAAFFDTKKVPITLTSTVTGTSPRTFDSTDDLVHEIIDARVYAGIHYRTSVVRGVVLGRKVARWAARYYFLPEP